MKAGTKVPAFCVAVGGDIYFNFCTTPEGACIARPL